MILKYAKIDELNLEIESLRRSLDDSKQINQK